MSYQIDAWAVCRHPDPFALVEHLVDRMARPGWSRDSLCWGCEHYDLRQGLAHRPVRPGAEDPLVSCHGCWFAALDSAESTPEDLESQIDAVSEALAHAVGQHRTDLERRLQRLRWARTRREDRIARDAQRHSPGSRYAAIEWRDGRHHVVRDTA